MIVVHKKRVEKLLGEILVDNNIITPEQLQEALKIQATEGGLIGDVVVRLGFATEEKITQCVSFQYGFPYLPLENYEVPDEVVNIVPKNIAQHYCIMPIDKIGDTLTVAMSNPLNATAIKDLADISSLEIQIFVSTSSDVRNIISRCYK